MNQPWPADEEGLTDCVFIEGTKVQSEFGGPSLDELDCEKSGREEPSDRLKEIYQDFLREEQICGLANPSLCDELKICLVPQLRGEEREQCLRSTAPPQEQHSPGFCYIDARSPLTGGADNPIVAGCPGTERRLLRIVGPETPRSGSFGLLLCQNLELGERPSGVEGTIPAPPMPPVPDSS